ncbi:MAG: hypothetical protein HKN10_10200 [Myxococcales bacterium]|nr:hypothetical protein [Myxococcales bacterium]
MKRFDASLWVFGICAALAGCSDGGGEAADPDRNEEVGFEILQIVSPSEIIVWLGTDLTQEEFDAIELPGDWFKNQPREGDADGGTFARSPDASADGQFTDAEHFGHVWRHNATIVEANVPLDDDALLRQNTIAKFHEIRFDAGRTLWVLVSPDGEPFVRVSRDAGRTNDEPTIPDGWQLVEYTAPDAVIIELPNPTLNIRADNEDSFQGPVPELGVGN